MTMFSIFGPKEGVQKNKKNLMNWWCGVRDWPKCLGQHIKVPKNIEGVNMKETVHELEN